MQIGAQLFLDMAERSGELCSFDIESTGRDGDYNSVLVVSVKPYNKVPKVYVAERPGTDKGLLIEVRDELERYAGWITYYGRGFDVPIIQTRLLKHRLKPLDKRFHIDMYYHLNAHIKTGRKSQGHRLNWLELPEEKMSVSAEEWNRVLSGNKAAMATMVKRCVSDTRGLEALYKRTRHLIGEITR